VSLDFTVAINEFSCDQTQANQHESKADNKHQSSVDVLTELIAGFHTPHSKVALRDMRRGEVFVLHHLKPSGRCVAITINIAPPILALLRNEILATETQR